MPTLSEAATATGRQIFHAWLTHATFLAFR
eukprot:SAG25_NODE_851_length_5076_cov_2.739401_9_plen_29_part_01